MVFMTRLPHLAGDHLVPSEAHPIRAQLRLLVHSALVA